METSELSILLVEDDANLGAILASSLRRKGFDVNLCRDGDEALSAYRTDAYNFVITDVMMPVMDGFTLAKEIRSNDADIPIIFITAKTLDEDIIEGFKVGADDYIVKPFRIDELIMRINAIARRMVAKERRSKEDGIYYKYSFKDLEFDYFNKTLFNGVKKVGLSAREADILIIFFKNENKAVERSYILNKIWNDDSYATSRNFDVYLAKLRSYLKPCEYIQLVNLRSEGIKLMVNRSDV